MKKLLHVFLCLVIAQSVAFAEAEPNLENVEIIHESSVEEESHITIQEVKDLVSSMPADATCLDSYLERRKQYILNLSLAPVYGVGAFYAGAYTGGLTAMGVAALANVNGWGALGYIIVGASAGVVTSVGYVVYDTAKSTAGMIDNNLLIKALSEQYLDREGPKTEKLYQKYLKKTPENTLSKAEFVSTLMELDASGKLCDGSMVKQPKYKIGFKLKYKVAKSKDLIRFLHQ